VSTAAPQRKILLVEDNPFEAELTVECFRETSVADRIVVVESGELAWQYLHQQAPFENAPIPALILLDLNLTGINGHELLTKIKDDPALCHIPVAIITTSEEQKDIQAAYRRHANCYIIKPMTVEHMINVAQAIERFWFGVVTIC
jgi:two-component system, chemotaxis family, response regulator Rcp1